MAVVLVQKVENESQLAGAKLILRYSQTKHIISFVSYCCCNSSPARIFGTNWSISMGSVVKGSLANDVYNQLKKNENWEKVCFRSQILERYSISEYWKYWNISGIPVLPEDVILAFFRTCWWHPEANNTGMLKWSSIVQQGQRQGKSLEGAKLPWGSRGQRPLKLTPF